MVCEYDKNIVEYLYQTKDTESHEDSDFCYDWGVRMCEFCDFGIERKAIIEKQIDCGFLGGINISLAIDNDYSLDSNNYGDYILDFRTDNQVSLCAEYDEDYISDREKIKINYCPMCGRKLVE